ncbi:MAG: hypothetical protein R3F31_17860 [Verrucomicrobiales bacterium]
MEIAEVITTLRQVVPRSVTLLCLNRDVWNSIFDGRIPSAWVDRLTGESMVLGDVPVEIAASLVKSRLATHGQVPAVVEAFWEFLARREQWQAHAVPQGLSPREVLRKARPAWDEWVSLGRDGQNQSRISPVPAPTVPQSSTNTIKSPRFPGSLGGPAKSSPLKLTPGTSTHRRLRSKTLRKLPFLFQPQPKRRNGVLSGRFSRSTRCRNQSCGACPSICTARHRCHHFRNPPWQSGCQ